MTIKECLSELIKFFDLKDMKDKADFKWQIFRQIFPESHIFLDKYLHENLSCEHEYFQSLEYLCKYLASSLIKLPG